MSILPRLRAHFPEVERATFLCSHLRGARPDLSKANEPDEVQLVEEVKARAARLLGVPAREVWLCPSPAVPLALLAALIPGKPRALDEAQGEAGLRTLLRSLRPELDWEEIAPSLSVQDPASWTRSIDEKTRLVVLSPVAPYTGAYRDPGAAIVRAAQVGAEVALDLRALLGVLPFVMPDPAPALLLGWSQGWLCGGAGLCFFWVRPDIARLFAAKLGKDTWPEPISKEALRLALAGMDLLGQVGAAPIYAQSQRQTQRLLEGVLARGFPSLTPRDPAQRGGIVSVAPPHFEAVARALRAHRVLVEAQAGVGIQVAPHVYTQDHEIDLFLSTLDQVIDRLEFERFLRPSRVALP